MYPWCMYPWCIYPSMIHVSMILDPDTCMYDAYILMWLWCTCLLCIYPWPLILIHALMYDAYIHDPWYLTMLYVCVWCTYLWSLILDYAACVCMMHISMILDLDPEACMYVWCMYLWCGKFCYQRTNKAILGVGCRHCSPWNINCDHLNKLGILSKFACSQNVRFQNCFCFPLGPFRPMWVLFST